MKYPLFFLGRSGLIIIFILFSLCHKSYGQGIENNEPNLQNPFWDNVRVGGSLGLGFGNGFFNGSLAPSAVYDFNSVLSAGVGLSAAYASQNNFKATSLGGSLIGMLRPIRQLQLSAEFEQMNINRRFEIEGGNLKDRYWVPALFLGIGYNTGPVVTGLRYDILHDSDKSFYSNALMPFVSVYF